jgi:flagellin-specific chaperone FliS
MITIIDAEALERQEILAELQLCLDGETQEAFYQERRALKAEKENKELREINDVLAAKLDSVIIVNCQALACSADVAAEVKRLEQYAVRTLLAEVACQSAQVEIDRLRNMLNAVTYLWHQAIDADILDDAHELEAAIVKASALLNYPPAEE